MSSSSTAVAALLLLVGFAAAGQCDDFIRGTTVAWLSSFNGEVGGGVRSCRGVCTLQ
jgi:hypothetical protein